MTIQQLQYILEVQRTGSISQAAKHFLVSQACVSSAVSTLEEELGFAIFTRGWRGVVPTERGLEVLKNARQLCEYHERILKTKEPTAREIRILSHNCQLFFDVFGQVVLENADRRELSFSCRHESSFTDAAEKLINFDAELFMACVAIQRAEKYLEQATALGLEATMRGEIPVVARIGAGHPLYNKPDLAFDDLREDTNIRNSSQWDKYPTALRNRIDFTPRRTIEVHSQATRRELLDKGAGFTVGAMTTVKAAQKDGVRSIPVPGAEPYRVVAVTNPQRPLSPEVKRYLNLLDEQLAEFHAKSSI